MDDDRGLAAHRGLMLLSIQPPHVQRILDGIKTVELRRTRPAIHPGQPIAIYSTSPVAAVVATCRVQRLEVGTPADIQATALTASGVNVQDFEDYFAGSRLAIAIHLYDVQPLRPHVTLSHLRSRRMYYPPQTWHFLDRPQLQALLGTHAARPTLDQLCWS